MTASLTARDRRAAAGLWVVAVGFFGLLAPYGLNIGEEGATVYLIARTAAGQHPYIDFISGYTPAYFYWHAALLRWFGDNLLVLRASVALANSLAVALLFVVSRPLLPRRWAILAALAYPALLPIVPALSCSFNVPYPTWYALLFWLVGLHLLQRWSVDRRISWLLLCGLLAGLSFSFKPNSGLFHLAAAALTVACAVDAAPYAQDTTRSRAVRAVVLALALAGIALVLRAHLLGREGVIFALPVVGVVGVSLWQRRVCGRPAAVSVASFLALLLGFALVTLPWMGWYWAQLGWSRFAHDVLFLNTGYEQFFYAPYRALALRDAMVVAAAAVAVGLAVAGARGWLGASLMAATLGLGVGLAILWVLLLAPMPEGFQRAVLHRVQDGSFGAALAIHAALIVALWRGGLQPRRRPAVSADLRLLMLGLAAVCCYLGAYPRSDFFHLSYSAPLTWVIGVWLVWRLVRLWQTALPGAAAWIDGAARAAVAAGLLVVAWPQLEVAGQVAWHGLRPAQSVLMRLDLRRAPLLVRRDVAPSVRDLVPVVAYLEAAPTSWPGLFTFPNLDLISFLSGRNTPARIGYFNPGWPDHQVEAEVVDALQERLPDLAVVADPASLFFGDAPAYYVLLRDLIQRHYREVGRVGSYALLRRADFAAPPFVASAPAAAADCDAPQLATEPNALSACLRQAATDARQLLLRVRESESPAAAAAVARWWGEARAASRSQRSTGLVDGVSSVAAGEERLLFESGPLLRRGQPSLVLLALRVVGELGDVRAAAELLRVPEPALGAEHDAWATALFYVAVRSLIDPFQFGRASDADDRAQPLDDARLTGWLVDSSAEPRLRFLSAWALSRRGLQDEGRRAELLPFLRRAFYDRQGVLMLGAAPAVVHASPDPAVPRRLLEFVGGSRSLQTSLLLDWSRAHPVAAATVFDSLLRDETTEQRELVTFLAGLLRDDTLRPALGVVLTSPQPRLRAAAVWSLGESGDPASLPLVQAAESDPDARVRRFARAARRQLEPRAGSG